jgi:iron-sulfur cluster insertion protein
MTTPTPLIFTENAAAKVWELIQEDGNLNLKLRVFVTGGGCSGFQYGFTFDEIKKPDDTAITTWIKVLAALIEDDAKEDDEGEEGEGPETGSNGTQAVQLLVDPISLQYLLGAEIDYREDIEGAQFIIRNPQAKTTCGCGSSFSA